MSRTITLTRGQLQSTAKTKTEARADLDRQINEALSRDYTPTVFLHRGYIAIVWEDPNGIHSRIVATPDDPPGVVRQWCGSTSYAVQTTREQAEACVRLHLADLAMDTTTDEPPAILDSFQYPEWRRKLGWSRACRYAKQNIPGTDNDRWEWCHTYAHTFDTLSGATVSGWTPHA